MAPPDSIHSGLEADLGTSFPTLALMILFNCPHKIHGQLIFSSISTMQAHNNMSALCRMMHHPRLLALWDIRQSMGHSVHLQLPPERGNLSAKD